MAKRAGDDTDAGGIPRLKRGSDGRYTSADGRFAVERSSSGWMAVDAEHVDDLGLPLVRGPFATLDEARAAIATARETPPPTSDLPARAAVLARPRAGGRSRPVRPPASSGPPPPVIRSYRPGDGDALRGLWESLDMRSWGDDDASLDAMARRNPGLLLVAVQGSEIVASALGAWDGRRGWIYHVATAPGHRRRGLARELVSRIETRLGELGAPKVNVIVRPGNDEGAAFWRSIGYAPTGEQFGHVLVEEGSR